MEFDQLEYLIAFGKYRTLSKAAEKLNISQPALTRAMQKLEFDFKVPLFARTKNRIVFNENGEFALKLAQDMIRQKEAMYRKILAFDQANQHIVIDSCAPMPLAGFRHLLLKKKTSQQITSELEEDEEMIIEAVLEGQVTIGILSRPISIKGFRCLHLCSERLYLSLRKDHEFAHEKSLSFHQIDGMSILVKKEIGVWAALCRKALPKSKLLFQENREVYDEIMRMSILPVFRTDLSSKKDDDSRVLIPIKDRFAQLDFYVFYSSELDTRFRKIIENFDEVDWRAV